MSGLALSDVITLRVDRFKWWLPQLLQAVAQIGDVTPEALAGPSRSGPFVTLRQAFAVAAREEMGKSFPQISRAMGRCDHTTALQAHRFGLKRCERDAEFRQLVGVVRGVARTIARGELAIAEIEPELAL